TTDPGSAGTATTVNASNIPVVIGARNPDTGGSNFFNGSIDEVRIYNYSMTAQEINDSARGVFMDLPETYPNATNVTGFLRLGDSSAAVNLTRNGTRISNGTSNTILNDTILLAAGIYQYNVTYQESQNYSAYNVSKILSVTRGNANITILFNASSGFDYEDPLAVWANITARLGDQFATVVILQNSTEISRAIGNASANRTFAAGIHNFSAYYSESQNWTNATATNAYFTINKGAPRVRIYYNGSFASVNNTNITYSNPVIVNSTVNRLWDTVNATLLRNGTNVGSAVNGNETAVLAAGFWNYTAFYAGDENYSSNTTTFNLTVHRATPILGIRMNNSNGSANSGEVLHLSFDENTTGISYDQSGFGNDASWTGGANNATRNLTGRFGNALTFDGVNDAIDLGSHVSLQVNNSFTVMAWVYHIKQPGRGEIVGWGANGWGFQIPGQNNEAPDRLTFGKEGVDNVNCGPCTVPESRWAHVAMTYNGTNTTFYIDGVQAGVNATPSRTFSFTTRLGVGARGDLNNLFNGSIDEVRIYNYSMTAAEINASARGVWNDIPLIYHAPVNTTGFVRLGDTINNSIGVELTRNGSYVAYTNDSSLLGWWQFDEANLIGNTVVNDSSGWNRNGTLISGVNHTTGKFRNALLFDAASKQYVDFGDTLDMGNSNFTMTAWIKTGVTEWKLISKHIGADGSRSYEWDPQDSTGKMELVTNDGTTGTTATANTPVNDNKWHHVAVNKDGTTVRFYLDGASDGTATNSATATLANVPSRFVIGCNSNVNKCAT
ncbi:MAG: hypothetical protein HY517_02065, partial [Candidatus Aenigmarchaeota archaeon]|nr:hypothetical protein [Candidatus Aenigmarchaeota archaeon]